MKALISFSTKHPVSVLMIFFAIVLCGVISILYMPLDFLPMIPARSIIVATEYDGISASEMRQMITIPLEESLAPLKGLRQLSSVSRDGLSLIEIELHWGSDIDLAIIDCRELIDINYDKLPSACRKPIVLKNDSVKNATVSIVMIPHDTDLLYTRYVADIDVKPRFQRTQGVGSVQVIGGEKAQIEVRVYQEKMDSRKLTLQGISEKISQANYEYPAGTIKDGDKQLLFKTAGLYHDLDEIRVTPLSYNEGGLIKVNDVANVIRGIQERESFFIFQGKPCIKIDVFKKQDASPVSVSNLIKKELHAVQQLYGKYYDFVIVHNASESVVQSLISLLLSGVIGSLVTFMVIWFVFKSKIIALLLSSVIPVSALVAIAVLAVFGKTLNTMSLSGIAIGIGMVIDAGAVVLEHLQKTIREKTECTKEDIDKAVCEVALSNIGSTVTTVVVFLPIFFMNGIISALFSDLAIAVIAAITASCLFSLSYIPAFFYLFLPSIKRASSDIGFIQKAEKGYMYVLQVIMQKKYIALVIMFICLALGTLSFICIEKELVPIVSDKRIQMEIELETGAPIDAMEDYASLCYQMLSKEDFVSLLYISGGLEKDNYSVLIDPAIKKEKLYISCVIDTKQKNVRDVKKYIASLFSDTSYLLSFVDSSDMIGDVLNIYKKQYIVQANKAEEALEYARMLVEDDSLIKPLIVTEEFAFTPDRVAHSRFGITALHSSSTARFSLEGLESNSFYENGIQIPIKILLYEQYVSNIGLLENIGVLLQDGSLIPLRLLGRIEKVKNEKVLYRFNRKDSRIIRSNISANVGIRIPEYALIDMQKVQLDEMTGSALFLVIGVIILLYLVMAAQFESFSIPLMLLLALPPAFVGAFGFLLLFGKTLNIHSIVALVVLFGNSVNNSILLYESCMVHNACNIHTITEACVSKLRAIIITNVTTIVALIPFAIDLTHTNPQSSLALAIIGGLLVSSLIVLCIVPVIFSIALTKRRRINEAV